MGDVADMLLDGTLCEACGDYIDDDGAQGFPRFCSPQCAKDRGSPYFCEPVPRRPGMSKARRAAHLNSIRRREVTNTHACPNCHKKFKTAQAAQQHNRDSHLKGKQP